MEEYEPVGKFDQFENFPKIWVTLNKYAPLCFAFYQIKIKPTSQK